MFVLRERVDERKRSSDCARLPRVFRVVDDFGGAVFGSAFVNTCDRTVFCVRVEEMEISS